MTPFNTKRADHQFWVAYNAHMIYEIRDLEAFMNVRVGYRYDVHYSLDAVNIMPAGAMTGSSQRTAYRADW